MTSERGGVSPSSVPLPESRDLPKSDPAVSPGAISEVEQYMRDEVARGCRFNCDADSGCRCAVHTIYRAAIEVLHRPARTGCDDCLEARRTAEADLQRMTIDLQTEQRARDIAEEVTASYRERTKAAEAALQRMREERDRLQGKADAYDWAEQRAEEVHEYLRQYRMPEAWGRNIWHALFDDALELRALLRDRTVQLEGLKKYVRHADDCAIVQRKAFMVIEGKCTVCGAEVENTNDHRVGHQCTCGLAAVITPGQDKK